MRNTANAKPRGSRFKIFGETANELRKVTWLTRREVVYLTLLVLAMTIAAGVILGSLDFGFTRLARFLVGG